MMLILLLMTIFVKLIGVRYEVQRFQNGVF